MLFHDHSRVELNTGNDHEFRFAGHKTSKNKRRLFKRFEVLKIWFRL